MYFSCNTGYRPEPEYSRVICLDDRWGDNEGTETYPTCFPGSDNNLFMADLKKLLLFLMLKL